MMKHLLLMPPVIAALLLGAFLGSEYAQPMLDNDMLSHVFRLTVFLAGFGYFVWYYKHLRHHSHNEKL